MCISEYTLLKLINYNRPFVGRNHAARVSEYALLMNMQYTNMHYCANTHYYRGFLTYDSSFMVIGMFGLDGLWTQS